MAIALSNTSEKIDSVRSVPDAANWSGSTARMAAAVIPAHSPHSLAAITYASRTVTQLNAAWSTRKMVSLWWAANAIAINVGYPGVLR